MTGVGKLQLVSQRLVLRDFEEQDVSDVYAFRSDPAVARFMDFSPESEEHAQTWLTEVIFHNRKRPRVAYNLAIELRAEAQVIGWIGIGDSERYPEPEECGFGYMLSRAHWGHGYATEAVITILRFGFQELAARRISAWCHAENVASARVLAKAGLHFEQQYRDINSKTGQPLDCLEYAVRLEQWRTTQRRDALGTHSADKV